ncbi:hypothetical protein VM1G_11936 [Cytospora mali]|uniref:Uncharacterized protein n=1 Tax=Cytospora mali TaxID=578113 RepID=A0A194WBI4_CYTMA|nr:hypothetical protein VM1G_11936 [Valsa mali]
MLFRSASEFGSGFRGPGSKAAAEAEAEMEAEMEADRAEKTLGDHRGIADATLMRTLEVGSSGELRSGYLAA